MEEVFVNLKHDQSHRKQFCYIQGVKQKKIPLLTINQLKGFFMTCTPCRDTSCYAALFLLASSNSEAGKAPERRKVKGANSLYI